jgi:glycosyltransferase involved in cell wall biosynthesis
MNAADLVTAVSPALAGKVRAAGRSEVELLPNAVHATAARILQLVELERGDRTVGYFGHLSEAWFDWDLLVETAVLRPNWRFYIIGYGGPSAKRHVPENIVLLGRQPRDRLAAFAANWDAAMVPFKPGPLAEGVDAIKIYEYLAMGLPVVATGIQPPVGAEVFVHRVEGRSAFLDGLETACGEEAALRDSARRYAAKQLWSTRLDQLLACLADGAQGVGIKRALFVLS